MNRRILSAAVAVLLATIGTLTLVAWAKGAEGRALAGVQAVEVLVVREQIAKGTKGEDLGPRVAAEQVPAKVQAAGAVKSTDELKGKVALVDLVPGEQLVASRFGTAEVLAAQSGVPIPPGLHVVTISLEPQRAVGGELKPGSTVGFVASFQSGDGAGQKETTHFTLHKVLVTNVQGEQLPADKKKGEDGEETRNQAPNGNLLVTLAVDAPSVERVVFAAEFGLVWLTVEPAEAPEDGTKLVTRDNIYQ
ncbi:MAG: RcpC/CpaB family pilus assembly protein [Actinomycetota bacterium]|nr:RcpC/CpaB family pilus assembly protein [Actinomycetota bacterium]